MAMLSLLYSLASFASDITLYAIHFPPYAIDPNLIPAEHTLDYQDSVYGADIDVIRAAYATQGINVHFKIMPWKRIMRDVKTGTKLGVLSCRPIETRKPFAIFSDKISHSPMVMATKRGLMGDQTSYPLEALHQYKPVTNAGWAQEILLSEAGIDYTVVNSTVQGARLILHRDRNVFVTDKNTLSYVLNRRGWSDQFSLYAIEGVDYDTYSVCFSRAYPRSEYYRQALNKGLAALRQSDAMHSIFQRYDINDVDALRVTN